MTKIGALVHHHCRDHCLCTVDTCLYRQAERHHLARKDVKFLGVDENTRAEYMEKPREEQLNLVRDDINKDYSENARFSRMRMSRGKKGRAKVKHETNTRLDIRYIDRVSLA